MLEPAEQEDGTDSSAPVTPVTADRTCLRFFSSFALVKIPHLTPARLCCILKFVRRDAAGRFRSSSVVRSRILRLKAGHDNHNLVVTMGEHT